MDPQRPTRKLGKYEILTELGKGAMGVVYKAQDPFLGRFVAIKTMSAGLMDDPDLLKRFYREAQSAGNLRHANIVTIYDLGEEDGVPYIAMEFLEGHDLEEIIRVKQPLNLVRKLNIIVQVCRGLDYAHRHGIVHRDVKPANVRVLADGDVKIVDFGIAHITGSNITRPDLVMGTVNYMSPEQIQTPKEIDRRSDIFSVGVILYEFLTYEKPFTGDTIPSTLFKIINEPARPISDFLSPCPEGVAEIVEKALAKNPADRFESCEVLTQQIEATIEKLKPRVIKDLMQAGQRQLEENEFLEAQKQYNQVLELDGSHKVAKTLLQRIEKDQRKFFEKRQAQNLLKQAKRLMGHNEFDEAIECYGKALGLDPQNTQLKGLIKEAEQKRSYAGKRHAFEGIRKKSHQLSLDGKLEEALQTIEEALSILPNETEGKILRKSILDEMALRETRRKLAEYLTQARDVLLHKKYDEARRLLGKALAEDPENKECRELLEFTNGEQKSEEARRALESLLARAKEDLANSKYTEALAGLKQAARMAPSDPRIERLAAMARSEMEEEKTRRFRHEKIGEAKTLIAEQNFEAAISLLEAAEDRLPKDPALVRLLAIARQEQAQVKENLYIDQELGKARDMMGQQRFKEAVSILESLDHRFPGHLEVHKNLERSRLEFESEERRVSRDHFLEQARRQMDDQHYAEALTTLETARKKHPNDLEIPRLIRLAQMESEQFERNRKLTHLRQEARELLSRKRFAEARRVLSQATDLDREDPDTQRLARLIERQAATEARKQAVSQTVQESKALLKAGQFPEAIAKLEECFERFPRDFELETLLKRARTERDKDARRKVVDACISEATSDADRQDYSSAAAQINQALEQYPGDPELIALLRQIEERGKEQERIAALRKELQRITSLIDREKLDEATRQLRQLKRKHPGDGELIDAYLQRVEESRQARKIAAERTIAPLKTDLPFPETPAAPSRETVELRVTPVPAKWWFRKPVVAAGIIFAVVLITLVIVNLRNVGELSVLSTPEDVTIFMDGKEVGVTKGGRLSLADLEPGTHRLMAHKEGFSDVTREVTILRGENPDLQLTLAPVATLHVRVHQPGVQIRIQGEMVGSTGVDGSITLPGLPTGQQMVTLFKESFDEWKQEIELPAGRTTEIDVILKPQVVAPGVAALRIASNPPDAAVFLKGKPVGTTAGGSLVLKNLRPGRVRVLAKKDGYEEVERPLTLIAGRTSDLSFTLKAMPATLQLTTNVASADVRVDGVPVGKTSESGKLEVSNLSAKRQAIQVTKEGYEPGFELADFPAGGTARVTLTLAKRTLTATTAPVSISSSPPGATVSIDGKAVARTPSATMQVTPGRHRISVEKQGYRIVERTEEFKAGVPRALSFTLEKEQGVLVFDGRPEGILANIKGIAYDTTLRKRITLEPGDYTVHLSKEGFTPQEQNITVRDQQTVTLTAELVPAPGSRVDTHPSTVALAEAHAEAFITLADWQSPSGWSADGLLRANGAGVAILKDRTYQDFTEQFSVRLVNGISACWVVRAQDERNFYLLQINGDRHRQKNLRNTLFFFIYKNGNASGTQSFPLPFTIGRDPKNEREWLEIKMEVSGRQIIIRGGGTVFSGTTTTEKELGRFQDRAGLYATGKIGFVALADEKFEITSLIIEPSH